MTALELHDLPTPSLRDVFGFGVAGNFAGHLEQAGEAADFTRVVAAADMPKGIFPWYAPGAPGSFLAGFPLSSDELAVPAGTTDDVRLQVEPEVGLLCDLALDDAGRVTAVTPRAIAAFDDCSIRRAGAFRISHKKHWGAASKGVAPRAFAVDDLSPDGPTASLRLACFLRRDGKTHAYGVDSPLPGYTLYGSALLDWLVDRLREQRDGDGTPLEDVGALLRASRVEHAPGAGSPTGAARTRRALVGIGATRYEPFGETTFVQVGDEAVVVVYDAARHEPAAVADAIAQRHDAGLTAASVLRRTARVGAAPPAFA